jgi:fatty acid desaturase
VTLQKDYPILHWRPAWDILACYVPIAIAIYLCQQSLWIYPIAALVIANRILALSLLCHEGLHGNLCQNRVWNDRIGRWFCAFPSIISFTRYRRVHFMHHQALGDSRWDPDLHLYNRYPRSGMRFLGENLVRLISLKTLWSFLQYYTDIPDLFQNSQPGLGFNSKNAKDRDFGRFLLFLAGVAIVATATHTWTELALYWLLPVFVILQPYVLLMGGLQHGPIPETSSRELKSRTISGPKWLMEIVLPCDINFHSEHHLSPSIPHYWLRKHSNSLETSGTKVWKENYASALRSLFMN